MLDQQSGPWPLLAAQTGLWLAQALDPTDPTSCISDCVEIHGAIDPELMSAAHRQVEAEAEAMRLRFVDSGGDGSGHGGHGEQGEPAQLLEAAGSPLHYLDLTDEPDPAAAAEDWIRADTARPFDLVGGALCNTALLKTAPERFTLYRRVHHAILDGSSLALLHERTAAIYTALAENTQNAEGGEGGESGENGESSAAVDQNAFPPFHLLLDGEREYRDSKRFQRDREYWLTHLPPESELVSLSGRTPPGTRGVQHHGVSLGTERSARLREAARRLGVGWPSVAIGVTALYLARLTGAERVVLGMPVAARMTKVEQRVPGMLTNGLPIGVTVLPGASLAEFFQRIEHDAREMLMHSRHRLEELTRELGPASRGRRLWGTVLNVMDFDYTLSFAGHHATVRNVSRVASEDLSVTFSRVSAEGTVELQFDTHPGLYTADEAAAHLERMLGLLDAVLEADPDAPLDELEAVGATERERLLAWGTGAVLESPQTTVSGLFESCVRRDPGHSALEFGSDGSERLDYAQLNERANRLARHLISQGAGAGQLVAFALPRSTYLHTAALGVLKSGAAFLPLDAAYPLSRISLMAEDAQPTLVLLHSTTAHLAGVVRAVGARSLVLDDPELVRTIDVLPGHDVTDDERSAPLDPHDPAYVIYTSGSTGVPKGVVVPHRGVVNVTAAMVDRLGSGPDSRTLQFASASFDAFVGEMTQSLLNGGTLIGAPAEELSPGPDLARLIARAGVNDLVLPPSALDVMDPQELPAGVTISVVGEACPPRVVELWSTRCRLFNGYGPTEATISTAMSLPLSPAEAQAPPIGTPLRNVRVYVLDPGRRLTPAGSVGELYVAGAGVTAGYLGRPELTETRFPSDAFGAPGGRMYRTGDLVRYNDRGELLFVGRADDQVKLRGFRIELGEVEAALAACPGVARAAAAVHEFQPGDRRLLGYVVPTRPDAPPDPAQLRALLAQSLPAHEVPATVLVLDALPLTGSGKIDRRALPMKAADAGTNLRPDARPGFGTSTETATATAAATGTQADSASAAGTAPASEPATTAAQPTPPTPAPEPRDELEDLLLGLFTRLLGGPEPALDDSFFDRGGHSLSAVRLIGRIRTATGVELTVRELFDTPTVSGLARLVRTRTT